MLRLVQQRETAVDPGDAFQRAAISASHRGEWQEARRLWLLAAEHTADDYRAGVRRANAERLVRNGRATAFTLMEVLIAVAIFALGAIAVAAIFPAAIYLQRETIQEVQANQLSVSAEAAMLSRRFAAPSGQWNALPPTSTDREPRVVPLPADALADWPTSDRSSVSPDNSTGNPSDARETYWVPLYFKRPGPAVPQSMEAAHFEMIYYFVLARVENRDYLDKTVALGGGNEWAIIDPRNVPGVRSIGVAVSGNRFDFTNQDGGEGFDHWVEAGDLILDKFGNIHLVTGADTSGVEVEGTITAQLQYDAPPASPVLNDRIWFAPRGATRKIGMMMNSVSEPLIVRE